MLNEKDAYGYIFPVFVHVCLAHLPSSVRGHKREYLSAGIGSLTSFVAIFDTYLVMLYLPEISYGSLMFEMGMNKMEIFVARYGHGASLA